MMKEKLKFQTNNFEIAKSSLMLLEKNRDLLEKKIRKYKGLPNYLRYLIKKYGLNLKEGWKLEFRNTKKYQDRGLNYTRVKFDLDGNTWMAYQLLAFYLRISISYLFTVLLTWDNGKENSENNIVTSFPGEIRSNFSIFLECNHKHDYECILEFKT